MVFCTRKQKICFIWTAAGVIAIETCVFFILLLIFTAEKFGTGEWEASNAGTEAVKSVKGYLTFLPSQRNNITVDFTNPDGEYMRNMKIILDEYAKSKTGHCPKAAALQLGDCDDSYGINQGVFCLVARLENTGNWVPDDFLQTDKLPNYRNDFLPISCDVRATNASTYRRGKPIDFRYEKELNNIWPASGFPKELFPLDKLTRNCYPAVTIKVGDPFVLRYPHEQITVTCRIWSYNSNQISASKVSINVTLLHREDSLFASARKPPRLPDHAKHTASLSESTTTREATLPATTQITPARTINIKPIDSTWPYPIAETILHTSSTNEPSTFMETSVFNKPTPLSTDQKIYTDLSALRASSHETTPRIVTEEASSAEASTRATPSPEEAVSSTQVTSTDLSTTASFLPPTSAEPEYDDVDITESLTEKIFFYFPLTTPQVTEEIEFAASGDREEPIFEKLVHYSSTLGSSSVPLDTTQSELNFFDNDVDSDENHPGSLTNSSSLDSPVDSTPSIATSLSELDTFSTLNADENDKHTQRWQESTTVTEAALHASTQVTPTSTSTTKLTDTPPTSIARSMSHTYSATTPSLTETSVITKLHPLPSTETVTYTGFKNISASGHENTPATFPTEPAVLDGHPRAAPSMEETARPTASKSTASFLPPTVATQQDFYTDSTPESTAETNFGFPLTAVQDSNKFHWQATGDTDQPIFPKENYTSSSETSLLPLGTTRSSINLSNYENASFDEIPTESVHVDLLDLSPTLETFVSQLTIISTLNSTKSDTTNPNENLNISMPTPTDTLVDSTSPFEHSYPLKTTLPTHDSQDNTTFSSPTEALPNTPSSLEPFPTKIATSSSTLPSNEEITASTYVSSQTPGNNNEDSHYRDNSSDDGQYDDPILGGGEN